MSVDNLKNREPHLKVGFILAPQFTLLPFTGFIEVLRQAADNGDGSRPIWCSWSVMSHELTPIMSSCGIQVTPQESFRTPDDFNYIVIIGGLLSCFDQVPEAIFKYLKKAAASKAKLIGLCTGSFILAQAGLLNGRRSAVHWYHYQDFKNRYPAATPIIDELFVEDDGIITSPGGMATTDLAIHLISRYFGHDRVVKILRHMIIDWHRPVNHPQTPYMNDYEDILDPRIRRAVFFMEENLAQPIRTEDVAEELAISTRQMERLFLQYTSESPAGYLRKLRLRHANWMLHNTKHPITHIAMECGFSDSSHFAKRFKDFFGFSPSQARDV